MRKYLAIFSTEVKNSLAYRADTWLTAVFSVFSVALAHLLWRAVFGGAETFNGFTLAQMTTYYLLSGILVPLTQSEGLMHDFSAEIKAGSYAKYMVKPMSPLAYFISASFARAIFSTVMSTVVLSVAMLCFGRYFQALHLLDVIKATPVIFLGAVLSMLIAYIISMATFRFTDIGFIYAITNVAKIFLAGSLIPLSMVFGPKLPMYIPFSYTVYYPVVVSMGKAEVPLSSALGILLAWTLILLFIALALERRAPKTFEGVGM